MYVNVVGRLSDMTTWSWRRSLRFYTVCATSTTIMYSSPTSLRPQGISAHLYLSAEFRDVETPSGRRL